MRVLLGGRGVGARCFVEPEQRNLDLLGARVNLEHPPCDADSAVVLPGGEVVDDSTFHDFKVGRVQVVAVRSGPFFVLEVERELARVQAELDGITSSLAVMRTRVSMSQLDLSYQSAPRSVGSDTFRPLRDALANFLNIVVIGFAAIIGIIAAIAIPGLLRGDRTAWLLAAGWTVAFDYWTVYKVFTYPELSSLPHLVVGLVLLGLLFVYLLVTAPLSKSLQPIVPPEIILTAADGTPIARKGAVVDAPPVEHLLIQDRGRTERVPLTEVLYLKSEFKYLTVRTATRSHILDGSLADFEERYPKRFVRVHRNALVARAAIRALGKYDDGEDAEGWALRLEGVPEPVVVSRRQLAAVREALKESSS